MKAAGHPDASTRGTPAILLAGTSHNAVARATPAVRCAVVEWERPPIHGNRSPRTLNLYVEGVWVWVFYCSVLIVYKDIRKLLMNTVPCKMPTPDNRLHRFF